jgi:hypothetical protein
VVLDLPGQSIYLSKRTEANLACSFESRKVCDEIISSFAGLIVGDEHMGIQLRYADTPAQKELKRITAERRQFRTNEYNVGAYGTPLVGMQPTIYANQHTARRGVNGNA